MKRAIRKLYEIIPFKKEVFTIIRGRINLPIKIWIHLYFDDFFIDNKSVKMRNFNAYFETSIFWSNTILKEKVSVETWKNLVKSSSIILDIGANSRFYSLVAACENPNAKNIAFESIERIYTRLVKNVKENNFSIICEKSAITNKTGEAVIFDLSENHHYHASIGKG